MANFSKIEIVKELSPLDLFKTPDLIRLYNYACEQDIKIRFYIDKMKKEKNSWLSILWAKIILIPVDPKKKEIVPNNNVIQKIYLVHEIAHFERNISVGCDIFSLLAKRRRYSACLYREILAWTRGLEILSRLGLATPSEIGYYKKGVKKILGFQCKKCLEILKKKPEECSYAAQIRNLSRAHCFDLGI